MRRRALTSGALVLSTVGAWMPPQGAAAGPGLPAWCEPAAVLRAEELPAVLPAVAGCDLVGRVVGYGSSSLRVPERGTTVGMSKVGTAGGDSFSVGSFSDGSVRIETGAAAGGPVGIDPYDPLAEPTTPDPCASAAASSYSKLNFKAYSTVVWSYNPLGAPSSVGDASSIVAQAATAIVDGHNDCGITTVPRTSFHAYAGVTTRTPQYDGDTCASTGDATSTVGWGPSYDSATLAVTCWWANNTVSPARLTTADIAFAPDRPWTTDVTQCRAVRKVHDDTPISTGVVGTTVYDFQGVATHEWGHVFGLWHVPDSGVSKTQTMSTGMASCSTNERTLGRGDLNGMLSIYGSL